MNFLPFFNPQRENKLPTEEEEGVKFINHSNRSKEHVRLLAQQAQRRHFDVKTTSKNVAKTSYVRRRFDVCV